MKKRTRTRSVRRGGFTLIEVLLVLAILGVIAAMVVPNLLGTQKSAYIKTTKQSISALETAAQKYAVTHNDGEWPATLQPLLQSEDPNIAPDLTKVPTDAWGTPLVYEYTPGDPKPIITSYGPNKQQGGGDDITNLDDQNQNTNL